MDTRLRIALALCMTWLSCGHANGEFSNLEDYVHLQVVESSAHHIAKRKVILFDTYVHNKWPTEIPFFIEPSHFTDIEAAVIRSVLRDEFEAHTCLTFTEISSPPADDQQFFYFRHNDNDTNACQAYIGMGHDLRTFHGQPIFLGQQCLVLRGTVIYMVASTLGMYGEVKRPDRNLYVDVYLENVDSNGLRNYAAESNDTAHTHDVPYDYGSAMQLPAKDWLKPSYFLVSDKFSVLPKDRRYARSMGQKSEFSFYDIAALNKAYCPDACANRRQALCHHGGILDPQNCGTCKCRDGFSGAFCHELAQTSQLCSPTSGELQVSDDVRCVESPNFNDPLQSYNFGDTCTWLLQAPGGKRIDAWFTNISLPSYGPLYWHGFTSCLHWVEIKDQGADAVRGPRYCDRGLITTTSGSNWAEVDTDFGTPNQSHPITSARNEMMIIFKAPDYRGTLQTTLTSRRFQLCYKVSSAPPISDPNSGDDKPNSERQTKSKSDNNDRLFIIGAVVGGLLLLLIILVLILICCVYRRRKRQTPPPTPQPNVQVACVNPGYAASGAVRISNSLQNVEIDLVKKDPEDLDFSQVGIPGQKYFAQFQPPPEYEESPNTTGDSVYVNASSASEKTENESEAENNANSTKDS